MAHTDVKEIADKSILDAKTDPVSYQGRSRRRH